MPRKHTATSAAKPTSTMLLTLPEVCKELQVARSTFYTWQQKHRAPKTVRLPNGQLRVRRSDLDEWLSGQEVSA